jgi:hypothetical protein
MDAPAHTLKDIVTDFLASAPTQAAIIAYRLPPSLQERAHYLLDKNKEGQFTPEEYAELDEFRQIDHLLTLIKAKARLKQTRRSNIQPMV